MVVAVGCAGCRPPPPRPAAPIELWIAGDVHLGANGGEALRDLRAHFAHAPGVVNLEGPIGDAPEESSEVRLVNGAQAAGALAEAGVAFAGIANNHAGDLGAAGTERTVAALEAARVQPVGMGTVGWLTRGGVRVAITAHDLSRGVPPELDAELRAARGAADALVATFHVLAPPSYLPPPELKQAVEVALEAGASVVAAHGSHSLAKVERRGAAVIAWGLGNLAFACPCGHSDEGLILQVALDGAVVSRAEVVAVDPGTGAAPARVSEEASLTFDLLESLDSSPIVRRGSRASF